MKNIEIQRGVNLHLIETNKFKTDLIAVFLTTPLEKKTVTANALIPAVLRRGNSKLKSQEEISKVLEEMYGASFDCGIDKIGNDQIIKFYLETINDLYLEEEKIFKNAIDLILDIVFNPLIENNSFKLEYLKSEKSNLKQVIEGRKDSKASYAFERCIEEMYKNDPYSLYKYGKIKDLEKMKHIHYINMEK